MKFSTVGVLHFTENYWFVRYDTSSETLKNVGVYLHNWINCVTLWNKNMHIFPLVLQKHPSETSQMAWDHLSVKRDTAYFIALIYLKTQKECAAIFSFQSEGYIGNMVKSPQPPPHHTSTPRVWPPR